MTTLDLFTDLWNDTQAALSDPDSNVTLLYPDDDAAYDTYHNATTSSSTNASYGYDDEDPYGYAAASSDPYSSTYDDDAKKKYGEDFYYGAMSVAVLTLGLVIIVEAILHRIDLSALHKPFYQAVLDAVYRECTLYILLLLLSCVVVVVVDDVVL